MPERKHNCVRCLKYAISWDPITMSLHDDGEIDLSNDIACVPSDEDESKCRRCYVSDKPCIPGDRKMGRALAYLSSYIDTCVEYNISFQEYKDHPSTKEFRRRGREALSTFRAVMSAKASAAAAAASEQQLLSVSSKILDTLVDISKYLATIANSRLPQAGTTQMPGDYAWDTSDDENNDDYDDEDGKEREDNDEDDCRVQ